MKNILLLTCLVILTTGVSFAQKTNYQKPEIASEFVHIFNPNDTRSKEDTTWYTNDHCFIKGDDGTWHAYGIIGHHPVDPWKGETRFFHITASSIKQAKWEDHDYALTANPGWNVCYGRPISLRIMANITCSTTLAICRPTHLITPHGGNCAWP